MKSIFVFTALAMTLAGASARADRIQICVDANSGVYKAHMTTFANSDKGADGVLDTLFSGAALAIPRGHRLSQLAPGPSIDDAAPGSLVDTLLLSLKHELAAFDENSTSPVVDEPKVYLGYGTTLVCSSSLDSAEYDAARRR